MLVVSGIPLTTISLPPERPGTSWRVAASSPRTAQPSTDPSPGSLAEAERDRVPVYESVLAGSTKGTTSVQVSEASPTRRTEFGASTAQERPALRGDRPAFSPQKVQSLPKVAINDNQSTIGVCADQGLFSAFFNAGRRRPKVVGMHPLVLLSRPRLARPGQCASALLPRTATEPSPSRLVVTCEVPE